MKLGKKLKNQIFALLFLSLGILVIFSPQIITQIKFAVQKSQSAGKITPQAAGKEPIKISSLLLGERRLAKLPERIIIPSINIDLYINEAKIVDGFWETSETTASHGEGSAIPGENGNIVVFAHAREGLFLNLRKIKKEDTVYILTKDNWHRYLVSEINEVLPNQVEVVSPTKNEALTLYTCSGFSDEKRLIVSAKPIK